MPTALHSTTTWQVVAALREPDEEETPPGAVGCYGQTLSRVSGAGSPGSGSSPGSPSPLQDRSEKCSERQALGLRLCLSHRRNMMMIVTNWALIWQAFGSLTGHVQHKPPQWELSLPLPLSFPLPCLALPFPIVSTRIDVIQVRFASLRISTSTSRFPLRSVLEVSRAVRCLHMFLSQKEWILKGRRKVR